MKASVVTQQIDELEAALLKSPAPSLGLFANVGGSNIFRRLTPQYSNFSFGLGKHLIIQIQDDRNQSLRAFYFCLIELCFSPEIDVEMSSNSLRQLKTLAYSFETEKLRHLIPSTWLRLHPNLSLRKLLAEYFQIMDYNHGNSIVILNQYPIIDMILCGLFRRKFQLETRPKLESLITGFRTFVECSCETASQVYFPQLQLSYDASKGQLQHKTKPAPKQQIRIIRTVSTQSIQIDDGDLVKTDNNQPYELPALPGIRQVQSQYEKSQTFSFGKRERDRGQKNEQFNQLTKEDEMAVTQAVSTDEQRDDSQINNSFYQKLKESMESVLGSTATQEVKDELKQKQWNCMKLKPCEEVNERSRDSQIIQKIASKQQPSVSIFNCQIPELPSITITPQSKPQPPKQPSPPKDFSQMMNRMVSLKNKYTIQLKQGTHHTRGRIKSDQGLSASPEPSTVRSSIRQSFELPKEHRLSIHIPKQQSKITFNYISRDQTLPSPTIKHSLSTHKIEKPLLQRHSLRPQAHYIATPLIRF